MKKFPTYSQNRKTAEKGVTLVKKIIEDEFSWIFRPTPLEHDFGIDGYVDIVHKEHYVTGKSIAVQIKTGKSYFRNRTNSGWKFTGENKHVNYYLNLSVPVLLLLVDIDKEKVYWSEFDIDNITKSRAGWSLNILKSNELNKYFKNYLYKLPGNEIDYMPQIEYQWKIQQELKESGIVILAVHKEDIVNLNFSGFKNMIKKMTANDEIITESRGKLSFLLFGYEDDGRELFEIEEVRIWAKAILPEIKYWGYFLNLDPELSDLSGLRILHLCSTKVNILGETEDKSGYIFMPEYDDTIELMDNLFIWLNEFCDKYHIPEEINYEQSEKIIKNLGLIPIDEK